MDVLYHLTIPRPQEPSLDAVVQDVNVLREHLGGEIVYLNPARRPGSRFPERLYGLQRLFYLRRHEDTAQLHHVFNSHLRFFPYLRWLRRPIVYSITAGLRPSQQVKDLEQFNRLAAIVVSNERDRVSLNGLGLNRVRVIRPGIDTTRFHPAQVPDRSTFTLLAGSSPWTKEQFRTKGVDALLEAAGVRPDLRLVLLWRGLLFDEIQARVAQRGLQRQVKIINEPVDVNRVLSQVHAAVVLATDASLLKAFPNSLLEALAAGRPVLVSRTLPMADYVTRAGCGRAIETVSPDSVLKALGELEAQYADYQQAALRVGKRDFSQAAFVEAHRRLYSAIRKGN